MSYTKDYQQYVDLYDSYQESKERLHHLEDNEKTASEKYRVEQAALEELRVQQMQAQRRYKDAESDLKKSEKNYASVTTFQSTAIENELSRLEQSQNNDKKSLSEGRVFQIKEQNTRAAYEQNCQRRIEKERAEVASRKRRLEEKISTLRNDPSSLYEEQSFLKYADNVYAIRRQLKNYLTASKKISGSSIVKRFKQCIKGATIQEKDVCFSSEYLCSLILNTVEYNYPTSNKKRIFMRQELKHQNHQFQ